MGSLRELLDDSKTLAQREGLLPSQTDGASGDSPASAMDGSGHSSLRGSLGPLASKADILRNLITWGARLDVARQCAEAVWYLHSRDPPLIHQDLKSANFLVTQAFGEGDRGRNLAGGVGGM